MECNLCAPERAHTYVKVSVAILLKGQMPRPCFPFLCLPFCPFVCYGNKMLLVDGFGWCLFFKSGLIGGNLRLYRVWSSLAEDGKACWSPKLILFTGALLASSPLGLVLTLLSLAEADSVSFRVMQESVPRLTFSSNSLFPAKMQVILDIRLSSFSMGAGQDLAWHQPFLLPKLSKLCGLLIQTLFSRIPVATYVILLFSSTSSSGSETIA